MNPFLGRNLIKEGKIGSSEQLPWSKCISSRGTNVGKAMYRSLERST